MSNSKPPSLTRSIPLTVFFFVLMFLSVLKKDTANFNSQLDMIVFYSQMVLAAFCAGRIAFLLGRSR